MKFQHKEARTELRILALLMVLMTARGALAQSETSAREVLDRYCRADAAGKQLEVGGWLQLARMFVPQRELSSGPIIVFFDKIEVIRGYTINGAAVEGSGRAQFTVHYSYVGEVDFTSLIFSPSKGPPADQEEKNYYVALTTKQYDVGAQGEEVLLSGPRAWRIEGSPFESHLTIDAAILHVARLRSRAASVRTKDNASAAIEALNKLRLGLRPDSEK